MTAYAIAPAKIRQWTRDEQTSNPEREFSIIPGKKYTIQRFGETTDYISGKEGEQTIPYFIIRTEDEITWYCFPTLDDWQVVHECISQDFAAAAEIIWEGR